VRQPVLEPRGVCAERGRAVQLGAALRGRDADGERRPLERDQLQLREDAQEAPGKRPGARLRPVAAQQRLERLAADLAALAAAPPTGAAAPPTGAAVAPTGVAAPPAGAAALALAAARRPR
jgi:hypothetical protein